MAGHQRPAPEFLRPSGRRTRILDRQIERRCRRQRCARPVEHLRPPGCAPSLHHACGQGGALGQLGPAARQRAEHTMHQPSRPALDQRQAGRDGRVRRRPQHQSLHQRDPEHRPRLHIGREPLRGCAIDQRIEIDQMAAHLGGNRYAERAIRRRQSPYGIRRDSIHRLPAPQYGIEQFQRSEARGQAGDCV